MTESHHPAYGQNTESLYKADWLHLQKRGTFEFVSRVKSRASAVIAAAYQEQLVLVEQYRSALQAHVLELPAGLVGDEEGYETESIADAATRELLEETGYEAARMHDVIAGPISSGLSSESMHFCYGEGLVKRHEGGGDETEQITVHLAPLASVDAYMNEMQQRGLLLDPKIYIGLYIINQYK